MITSYRNVFKLLFVGFEEKHMIITNRNVFKLLFVGFEGKHMVITSETFLSYCLLVLKENI